MKNSAIFLFLILLMSCQTDKKSKAIKITDKIPDNFQMYKTSEMADLMRIMLAKNTALRQKIITGDSIGSFNEKYLQIHTATLTDSTDLDATYPIFANHFLEMQKGVFNVDQSQQKEQFNKVVDACIACHKDRCTGPIPRIEKLRIK